MPKAALLAVTPPPSPEERRAKRLVSPSVKGYGRGRYSRCDIPRDLLELGDILDCDRRIPVGGTLDSRVLSRLRRNLRTIHALGKQPPSA